MVNNNSVATKILIKNDSLVRRLPEKYIYFFRARISSQPLHRPAANYFVIYTRFSRILRRKSRGNCFQY